MIGRLFRLATAPVRFIWDLGRPEDVEEDPQPSAQEQATTSVGFLGHTLRGTLHGVPHDLHQPTFREASFEPIEPHTPECLNISWHLYLAEAPDEPVEIFLTTDLLQSLYSRDRASWVGLIDYVEDEIRLR